MITTQALAESRRLWEEMGNTADFAVRTASPKDAEAVSGLLQASYQSLMAFGYEPVLFARAFPILAKANPMLLSCGTWYVAEVPCVDGSELARTFFTPAGLVGAAMCSACLCGSHDRWP
jgi:hypothetical protein